mmetsp:Transcript_87093/g.198794  ORF Transcript_87093/g.198794 Transcript_87093/m.198794 type:complete len:343 (-) Transcript_87093:402-1430(-)
MHQSRGTHENHTLNGVKFPSLVQLLKGVKNHCRSQGKTHKGDRSSSRHFCICNGSSHGLASFLHLVHSLLPPSVHLGRDLPLFPLPNSGDHPGVVLDQSNTLNTTGLELRQRPAHPTQNGGFPGHGENVGIGKNVGLYPSEWTCGVMNLIVAGHPTLNAHGALHTGTLRPEVGDLTLCSLPDLGVCVGPLIFVMLRLLYCLYCNKTEILEAEFCAHFPPHQPGSRRPENDDGCGHPHPSNDQTHTHESAAENGPRGGGAGRSSGPTKAIADTNHAGSNGGCSKAACDANEDTTPYNASSKLPLILPLRGLPVLRPVGQASKRSNANGLFPTQEVLPVDSHRL